MSSRFTNRLKQSSISLTGVSGTKRITWLAEIISANWQYTVERLTFVNNHKIGMTIFIYFSNSS